MQLFGKVVQLLGLEIVCKTRVSASVVTPVTRVTPIFKLFISYVIYVINISCISYFVNML